MVDLIKIDNNGKQAVSARDLYQALELDISQWARWYKKNILNNPYAIESEDWVELDIMSSSNNGIPTKDFVLTPDFAKKLAMQVRTEKGEAVRNYFLECERKAKAALKPKSKAEALLESVQLLVEHENRLSSVEQKLQELEESRNESIKELLVAERSQDVLPEETMRAKIRRLINHYCTAKNANQQSVWHLVYDRLYYRYGINLRTIVKNKKENNLDVAERLGYLDKIFSIVSNELIY